MKIGDHLTICDLYYFMIDDSFHPDWDSPQKGNVLLQRMVERWLDLLKNDFGIGRIVYLPISLMDEYVGCFKIERLDPVNVSIVDCYSKEYGGYSFVPSTLTAIETEVTSFRNDSEVYTCSLSEIVSDFTRIKNELAALDLNKGLPEWDSLEVKPF